VAKAAGMSAAISSRTCELVQALLQGSAKDAVLAGRLAALDDRRRREIARYFEQVASRSPSPSELDEAWLLTSAETFHMLVHRSGWPIERHEHWLAGRLLELIVRDTHDLPQQARAQRKKL
jgi:hypothetical protein